MYLIVLFSLFNLCLLVKSVPDYENINYNIQINAPIASYGDDYVIPQTFVVLRDRPFNITLVDYASAGAIEDKKKVVWENHPGTLTPINYQKVNASLKPIVKKNQLIFIPADLIEQLLKANLSSHKQSCRNNRYRIKYNLSIELNYNENKWTSIIKVEKAFEKMSAVWMCILGRRGQPDQKIYFKVRVKGVLKMKASIGGIDLKNSLSPSSELEYDNIAYYWYSEGEHIDLVCHTMLNVSFMYYLEYIDSNGKKLIETDRMKCPPNIQKAMRVENNNDIVDCKYAMYDYHTDYKFRIVFKLITDATNWQVDTLEIREWKQDLIKLYARDENADDRVQKALEIIKSNLTFSEKFKPIYGTKITINKMSLVPANITAHGHKEEYQYKFYEGQILTITCEKNIDLPGDIEFGANNNEHLKHRILEETIDDSYKKTLVLDTTKMSLEHLKCVIIDYQLTADVMLTPDTQELLISGLLPKDVIHQYYYNDTTWIIDYQYRENQLLNLTCHARNASYIRWIFGNDSAEATENKVINYNKEFLLQADHNNKSLVCKSLSNETFKGEKSKNASFGIWIINRQQVIVNLHLLGNREETLFDITPAVNYQKSETYKIFVVLENDPFNITLMDYNASDATCCQYSNKNHCFSTKLENIVQTNEFRSVIQISEATRNMSTVWKCSLESKDSTSQDILFDLRVKGANTINVTISGLSLNTTEKTLPEHGYDNIAQYLYEPGEVIDLNCAKRIIDGTIRLLHYKANGTKIIETDPFLRRPINYRTIMRVDDSGSMIDCEYKTEYYHYQYTSRTIFNLKPEVLSNRSLDITVDNLKLIPLSNGLEEYYRYKFFEGEQLRVSCEKKKDIPGNVQFMADDRELLGYGFCEETVGYKPNKLNVWKQTLQLKTDAQHQKYLKCNVSDNELPQTANILLVSEAKELYILGLSANVMISQYTKNETTWILDYNYIEDQIYDLTCVSNIEGHLRWIFGNNSKESLNKSKSISHTVRLPPEQEAMSITCEAVESEFYTTRAIVNFVRDRRHLLNNSMTTTGDETSAYSTDFDIILIVSYSMGIVVSICAICVTIFICRKKKDSNTAAQATRPANEQQRPLPEVPRLQMNDYNYAYSTCGYEEVIPKPSPPPSGGDTQNTAYYWAYQ